MPRIEIYNEDCFKTMDGLACHGIDVILTSPFYNTNKKAGKGRTLENTIQQAGKFEYVRYDVHIDSMTNDEYCQYTVELFNEFERILVPNGCVLYNLSYGNENTECMFQTVSSIISKTDFTVADVIVWKKKSAMPNNCSQNRLTRIVEFIFVFCRKNEIKTFHTNKNVVSERPTGQKMYENILNYVEARNNDGVCPYNKARFSSELCEKLLNIYCKNGGEFTTHL